MSEVRISTERLIAHSLILILVCTLLYYLLPAVWRYLSPFLLAIPFAAIVQPIQEGHVHGIGQQSHVQHMRGFHALK